MASAAPAASSSAAPAGAGAPSPGAAPGVAGGGEARPADDGFDPQADIAEMFEDAPFEHPDASNAKEAGEAIAEAALREARGEGAAQTPGAAGEEAPEDGEQVEAQPVVEEEAAETKLQKVKIGDLEVELPEAAAKAVIAQLGRTRAEAERATRAHTAGQAWMDAAGTLADALKAQGVDPRAVLEGRALPSALRPGVVPANTADAAPQSQAQGRTGAALPADANAQGFDFDATARQAYSEQWFQAGTDSLLRAMQSGDDAQAREAIAETLAKLAEGQIALTRRSVDALRSDFENRLKPYEEQVTNAREAQETTAASSSLIKEVAGLADDGGALMFPDLFVMTAQGPRFNGPEGEEAVAFIMNELIESNAELTAMNFGKAYIYHYGLKNLNAQGATAPAPGRRPPTGDPSLSGLGRTPLAVPRRGHGTDRETMPAKAPRSVMGSKRF